MSVYQLRYFFDCGSGICLWADSPETRERFGYPIDFDDLDLPPDLHARGEDLLRRFDTSLDWADPAGPSPWSDVECREFHDDAGDFLRQVERCLGAQFVIRDARVFS